ncbi:MAG: prepilin peptidase [Gemmatimonadaceae bacterium]
MFYVIGALGAGDVKFFAAIGSWLGPALTWRAVLVAAVIGGVLATAFLLWERRLAKTLQRIALAVSFRNPHLVEAPAPNARPHAKLPYGVALASGAFIAAWWPHLLG